MSYRPTSTITCAKCGKEMEVYRNDEPHRWCRPCIVKNRPSPRPTTPSEGEGK